MLFFDCGTCAGENDDQDAWLTPCHSRLIDVCIAMRPIMRAWNIAIGQQLYIDELGAHNSISGL